jgi:ABC-type amino acid transport substrate-binding protein
MEIIPYKIRVAIKTGEYSPLAYKKTKNSEYMGLSLDIWNNIKNKLSNKYEFEEEYISDMYSELIDATSKGKYDIVIAPFRRFVKRMDQVIFTDTIFLSKNVILNVPEYSFLNNIMLLAKIVKGVLVGPLLLLLIIGTLFGVVLHTMDPYRFKRANVSGNNGLKRSILTSVAALFGEFGFLTENASMTYKGIITAIILMVISFIFVSVFQANMITSLILQIGNNKTTSLKGHTLIAPKGYVLAENFKRFGAKIEYIDGEIIDCINLYLKNQTKYMGVALNYMDASQYVNHKLGLTIDQRDFGFIEMAFVINDKIPTFVSDVNLIINDMKTSMKTETICKAYLQERDLNLCSL